MINFIAFIISLAFVLAAVLVVRHRWSTVTSQGEPDSLAVAYDKKRIAAMQPIEAPFTKNTLIVNTRGE